MKPLFAILAVLPVFAEETPTMPTLTETTNLVVPSTRTNMILWRASAITLAGGNAFDFASSVALNGVSGVHETNGLYSTPDGHFATGQGLGIKIGLTAAFLVPEYFLIRRFPKLAKPFAVLNFGVGGAGIWAGAHNLSLYH